MTIQQVLDQKVWAVIGATHKTDKFGYKIYIHLKNHGYEVYPVTPNIDSIDGVLVGDISSNIKEVERIIQSV